MNLTDVMNQVATRLDTITGLRVFAYPPDSLVPPAAVVTYPESITFDETYGRGMDRLTLPVVVLVGRVSDRASRDALGPYCNGSGASSVKAVVESGTYSAFHTARVMSVDFDFYRVEGIDYLAAIFDIDIAGTGA